MYSDNYTNINEHVLRNRVQAPNKYATSSHIPCSPIPGLPPLPNKQYHSFNSHPKSAEQFLHYNNLILQNTQLYEDNKVLLIKLQKYQKLQPYIEQLIARNAILQDKLTQLSTQNTYLSKNIKQLHIENKNLAQTYENRIKHLQLELRQQRDGKVILNQQNANIANKINMCVAQMNQYKDKIQQMLKLRISLQERIKQLENERDNLTQQINKLQNYNREISKNAKNRQNQLQQKIEQKQKLIKSLQKQIQEQKINLQATSQNLLKANIEHKYAQQTHNNLIKNHQQLLTDHKSICLLKAQLQGLLQQSQNRILRRQQQLLQVQYFREQQRDKYNAQMLKIQNCFATQKKQLQNQIQHKIFQYQKLQSGYNQLMLRVQFIQKQIFGIEGELEAKIRNIKQLSQQLQLKQRENKQLKQEILSLKQTNGKLQQRLQKYVYQNSEFKEIQKQLQDQYKMRQLEYDKCIKELRNKYTQDRVKWEELCEQDKMKLKLIHEYEKNDIEEFYMKKVSILQGQLQEYMSRLNRAENNNIYSISQMQIQKAKNQIQNKIVQKYKQQISKQYSTLNTLNNLNQQAHRLYQRSLQKRMTERDNKDRSYRSNNIDSGTKTVRVFQQK